MDRSASARGRLGLLLPQWHELLQSWALDGAISRAAQEALQLGAEAPRLTELVSCWATGDLNGLPPIELLPAASMPGAAGAYAVSTGTIYLNQNWLQGASQAMVMAVLTEELGHHLDAVCNSSDTPGDEGELFAALLLHGGVISTKLRERLLTEMDQGSLLLNGDVLAVEQASVISAPIPVASPGRTGGEWRSFGSFAALRSDGSVVTWGLSFVSRSASEQLRSGVTQIYSNLFTFAALKSDGSVVTWSGSSLLSGAVVRKLSSGVKQIFSSEGAFAALKTDGSVITWGDEADGADSSRVVRRLSAGVVQIFSTDGAFAALKTDGSVVTWGDIFSGGNSGGVARRLSSGVTQIFSTYGAFAALKADGSVVTWGDARAGGDSSLVARQISSGVNQVFSNGTGFGAAFAALKTDGSVITWGDPFSGGDSSRVAGRLVGVTQIFSTDGAFAALKTNGSVVTWGDNFLGANSGGVARRLSSGVTQIYSTYGAFAALKADGSVVTWGSDTDGGDSSGVSRKLSAGVVQIFSTDRAFAALKADGSVITWGDPRAGGDSSVVFRKLSSGVTKIFSSDLAFAALKADGSVVTWGDSFFGGDSSEVAGQLTNVVAFANPFTDDRLVFSSSPSITLAVSPASVTEDGTSNLIYTFTRTGLSTSPLTVNYSVGGTARLVAAGADPADYRFLDSASTATSRTVTFAAGSASATVTVDPIADTGTEANETVALTLTAGSDYFIGTRTAVTGTIVNDDVTSAVSFVLGPNQVNLSLIGTSRINGTGNSLNNTIIGNAANNVITGLAGKDILSGGGNTDRDVFAYVQLSDSLLLQPNTGTSGYFDEITDFRSSDRISAPFSVQTDLLTASFGRAASLSPAAIAAVLTRTAFAANSVAAFTAGGTSGTFIAMNDSRAGFQAATDALVLLRNYSIGATNFVEFG